MAPALAAVSGGEGGERNTSSISMSMKTTTKKKAVCVMDASGVLGSALVKTLLSRGYIVHAVLQSQFQSKLKGSFHSQQWKRQCGVVGDEDENLRVFQADILDYHTILHALTDCSALFYSFEPPLDYPLYDENMAEIEVRAAHNVLEACAQTDTIDKVIFTSSVTAVVWTHNRNIASSISSSSSPSASSSPDIDERNWSDINFCKKFKLWHAMSKTLAEKTAWALAMDRGVSMVSINAGLLLPADTNFFTSPTTITTTSTSNLPPYLKGAAEMYEDGVLVTVDLRFLVDAHICVFEDVSSYGRYLCFNHVVNCHEDAVKLANMLMSSPPPSHSLEDTKVYPQRISNKKLNKLMVNFDGQFQLH